MRFHVLLPFRDEADIIGQCLKDLLRWADTVYAFDTGSVDDGWEIVEAVASRDRRVKLLGREPVYFSEARLRGWLFHRARRHMRDGDWFLRADADEIHHIPPPEFVRDRLRRHETVVYHQYYDFRLRQSDVVAWETGAETIADRQRPIDQRRRWFMPNAYSEPRLCRYRETMRWPATVSFPFNAGYLARERLPIRHYPHRDPLQLQRRCQLRAVMMADSENSANWSHPERHHWSETDWRRFVVADDAPGLTYWTPGADLPEVRYTNHLSPLPVRALQRAVHAVALPIVDRIRAQASDADYPQKIPSDVTRRLEQVLRE